MEDIVQGASHSRLGRAAIYLSLTALLGIAAVTLSQCTQVGDNLTGVALLSGKKHGKCLSACDKTYHNLVKQEEKLHKQNLKACRKDDGTDGKDEKCEDAENARHKAELFRLQQAHQGCKADCHSQGAGQAG
jgi:hypothetical protein